MRESARARECQLNPPERSLVRAECNKPEESEGLRFHAEEGMASCW